MRSTSRVSLAVAVVTLALCLVATSAASNCNVTSVGFTPLNDLGTGLYLGQFQGGLYPGGSSTPPAAHNQEGLDRAAAIQPLNTSGQPRAHGKIVLLSIGLSNTTQEFCSQSGSEPCDSWTFMGRAAANPNVDTTHLVIANGAQGGQDTATWDSPTDLNYDRVRDNVLAPKGLSERQVQAVWVKHADAQPTVSLPNSGADAVNLVSGMGNVARALKVRYPNLQMAFFSSRIYAGYASSTLNPEPFAYESGFAVKWLIQAQIKQMAGQGVDPLAGDLDFNGVAPWLIWSSYLWADGLHARSDGLTWSCSDFESDGTHPSQSGESKVGQRLLQFFLSSPYTVPWFHI